MQDESGGDGKRGMRTLFREETAVLRPKRESKIRRGQVYLNKDEDDRLLSTQYHTLTIDFEWKGEDMNEEEQICIIPQSLCPPPL